MGIKIKINNERIYKGEKIADLNVKSTKKFKPINCPTNLNSEAIDEFLLIFLVAAKAKGVSYFKKLSELNQKESPRLLWGSKILDKIGIRNKVTKEIEEFKKELVRQQELNDQLGSNLKAVQEANKKIAGLLANTDIIKNSLADPKLSEEAINEQVDLFFGAIGCVSGGDCMLPPITRKGDSNSTDSGGNTGN